MIHDDKRQTIKEVQTLIDSDLEVPFYNLKRLLDLNGIEVSEIIFKESDEPNLSIHECSNLDKETDSVRLIISEKSWIDSLPSIYKENLELKSFLYGIQVSVFKQKLLVDHIEDVFIPRKSEFLDWLASWYGVGFSSLVDDDTKRRLIYKLIELYKKRGTKEYLIEIINILAGVEVEIKEREIPEYIKNYDGFMTEEYNLKISFTVKILNDFSNNEDKEKLIVTKIKNIIEREKPAFTSYYIDSNLISKESKGTGIDMKIEEVVKNKDSVNEKPIINHYQHEADEKEEVKLSEEKKASRDEDDDFFSYD